MIVPGDQTWVYWFLDEDPVAGGARAQAYRVERLVPVRGEAPPLPSRVTRVESAQPLAVAPTALRGVAQHLGYTDAEQKRALDQASRKELGAGADTVAVLIPMRKSAAWWSQPLDQRRAHFRRQGGGDHTAIGLPYARTIYRKLYHCRYLEAQTGYDFLTYFELPPTEIDSFRALLSELRATPEWGFVDREWELWMRK